MRRVFVALHCVGLSTAGLAIDKYRRMEADKYLFDQEIGSRPLKYILLSATFVKDLVEFITFDMTLFILDPAHTHSKRAKNLDH